MYRAKKHLFNLLLVLILTVSAIAVSGQPTAPGHIVFTGYQTSGPTTNTDQFAFVTLVSMPVGTVIKFTDNAWNSGSLTFNTTESNATFTVTPAAIPAGGEVRIILGPPAQALLFSGVSAGTVVVTGPISMPTAGEQTFAYIGPDLAPTAFLSGFHNNVETGGCGVTTAAGWDPSTCVFPTMISNNTSMKPATLTTGGTAFWSPVEHQNWKFTGCGLDLSTAAAVRAAVNNPANWIFEDQLGSVLPAWGVTMSGCSFLTTPTAANVSVSGRVTTGNGRGLRNARVILTDLGGNSRSALTSAFGYFRFDDVQAGETYVIGVSSKQYQFTPRTINVVEELADVDFIADSGSQRPGR